VEVRAAQAAEKMTVAITGELLEVLELREGSLRESLFGGP
jgi:hypothetical protein